MTPHPDGLPPPSGNAALLERAPGHAGKSPRETAIEQQSRASDPAVSAFVAASAGSGKTKLLTDRILRLMLSGTPPARIQCLTFTKAAAAEMSLRLQHRLGEWVTLDDAALDARLRDLQLDPSEHGRATARRLFARVLDLPGGMRIGTIHAFCQSLLRRFPLEAQLSPHFDLVEEVEAEAEMRVAREAALEQADPAAVALAAGLVSADNFARLVHALQAARTRLQPLLDLPEPDRARAVRQAAGAPARSEQEVVVAAVSWPGEAELAQALRLMVAHGANKVRERAMEMLAWLGASPAQRAADWPAWLAQFFDDEGRNRKFGQFPNKSLASLHPGILTALEDEQARLWEVEDGRRAVRCADATLALLHLAAPSLHAYADQKRRAGLLDYNDLIGLTERLLRDPGAAWVLFKLDGGIDHLLLDEVQDTAPEQWRIAHRLTEEFFAGAGAEPRAGEADGPRTFFAVGDPKQSIYSFQGADPDEFARSRATMARRVTEAGLAWRDEALEVSFRSTAPVLALVDSVFDDPVAAEGVVDNHPAERLRHEANRAGAAGRVELWPLSPRPEEHALAPWEVASANRAVVSGPQRLAAAIAARIGNDLRTGVRLPSRDRPVAPGDILILVQRRGEIASGIVAALKAAGVPVAGLDVMMLTEQAAVQDLLAACDAVLLPQDCLSVAAVLTSPLGGLADDSLMHLAMARPRRLWDTLRDRHAERPDWTRAWTFLSRLSERADYVSPHALLVEALGPLGGRARLLARLGAEAAEPIDELLNAALAYTRLHPPGLQGFVHWIRRSGAKVKREPGGAGSVVRVMTAHGAKGLQAPVVILPDTVGWGRDDDKLDWVRLDAPGPPLDVPLWAPRRELAAAGIMRARNRREDLRRRERNRLLYVALTRAEDQLIVCGWEPNSAVPENSWYKLVERGMDRMHAATTPFESWPGPLRSVEAPQLDPVASRRDAATPPRPAVPRWTGEAPDWTPLPPPEEPALPKPLSPSRPAGEAFGPVPPAASPLLRSPGPRFARGNAVHELLQHLPALAEPRWDAAIAAVLRRTGLPPALGAEVLAVLRHPALAELFGPAGRAEQPLTGLVGGHVVTGIVDRLAILPGRVLLADFKTGRPAPPDVADTPPRYLRQLAAYRAVLRMLYPDRPVHCALVWTEGPTVAEVPPTLLDRFAPGGGAGA